MITGINHITLSVKNINESYDFYNDLLKLKPIMKSNFSAYFLAGNIWLALQEENDKDQNNNIYNHIAFSLNKNDFYKLKKNLLNSKIKSWQKNKTEGDSFYFLDPSGNKLEIHYSNLEERINFGKKKWDKNIDWMV